MKKVLITTSSFDIESNMSLQQFKKGKVEFVLNPFRRRLTGEEAKALISEHKPVGLIAGVEPLGHEQLESCGHLKVISRCGTGLDTVDLTAAAKFGIKVYNTPDAPSPSVAELALGLILCCLRQIPQADRNIRNGTWGAVKGSLLSGKTVGIIGFGRIGRKLAKLLSGFNVKLMIYDPYLIELESLEHTVSIDLLRLLSSSDIVSLHLPYGPHTHHLLNRERIFSMKKGSVLVNVSRGGLVDESALHEAISSGHVSAAGLDVFEEEPYSGPLKTLPQVVMTCHMGSSAQETRTVMEEEAAANLLKGFIESGILMI